MQISRPGKLGNLPHFRASRRAWSACPGAGWQTAFWAKSAWSVLESAQLTQFRSELERSEVVIRFLCLTQIFADFYELAFQDGHTLYYTELADSMGLSKLRVGQLLGRNPDFDRELDESQQYSDVLRHLAYEVRGEICRVITDGFGDESQLFISLWRTNPPYADREKVTDHDIVNSDLTPDKTAVFAWITEGCYPQ